MSEQQQGSIARRLRRNTPIRASLLLAALAFAPMAAASANEIRATDLQAAFKANNLRAENQYSGRQYDVVGQFDSAESTLFGGVSVTMAGENMFIASFMGSLADEERSNATLFNKGDAIRLRCTLGGTIMSMPTGKDCRFVTAATLAQASPPVPSAPPAFVAAPTTAQTDSPVTASEDPGYAS